MIGVVLVTRDEKERTLAWLEAHRDVIRHPGSVFLLLDNNSADGTVEAVRLAYPDLQVLALNDNYGCVTGRNIGIVEVERRGCRYVTFFDNDVYLRGEGYLDRMRSFLEDHPGIMGTCPTVLSCDGKTVLTAGGVIGRLGRVSYLQGKEQRAIHVLPGGAQFLRLEAFRRGGVFDNDLSPYGMEDYEWGFRARRRGLLLVNLPEQEVVHRHDWSFRQTRERMESRVCTRVVFLRKYPSAYHILNEVQLAARVLLRYGAPFTVGAYRKGLARPIRKGNYEYPIFFGNHELARYLK